MWMCRPSLCLFNVLGFAYQRFLESAWVLNQQLAEIGFPIFRPFYFAYWCKGVVLKLQSDFIFLYTMLNIWKISCFLTIQKLRKSSKFICSFREQRFIKFSSVELHGQILMTPQVRFFSSRTLLPFKLIFLSLYS